MKREIIEYFEKAKIEYFAVLDYSDLKETSRNIMEREGFVPRSAIIYLVPYYAGPCDNLSVYAGSLDYHIFLSELGTGLVNAVKAAYPASNAKSFGDHSPIDERNAACAGGLGILGKNGLVINERYGTYVFIGEVITDIPPSVIGAQKAENIKSCSSCGACFIACPTGALSGGGECLSAITQKKGELTDIEADLLVKSNTVWGCDACQNACPYNESVELTPIAFFYKDRITHLDSSLLSSMSKEDFIKRAFAWRGRKTVERNLNIYENENSK